MRVEPLPSACMSSRFAQRALFRRAGPVFEVGSPFIRAAGGRRPAVADALAAWDTVLSVRKGGDMNERQLQCFVTVAKYLNFTRAAEDLYMTQAAVTYQMSELEKSLKVRLFNREQGRVSLTEAGESFLDGANTILQNMDAARRDARGIDRGELDSLCIACYGDVLFPLLPDLLRRFRRARPQVAVTLAQSVASRIVENLNSGAIDVGFLTGYGDYAPSLSWLDAKLLFVDSHCAVMPADHPLASRRSIAIEELERDRKILFAEKELLGRDDSAVGLDDVLHLEDPQSVVAMVAAGYGVSICVSHVAPQGRRDVACVPVDGSAMSIYVCARKGPRKEALTAFLDEVEKAFP